VPATRHALTDFPPRRVYLDTNFLLSCLFTTYPYHAEAGAFMVNLATSDVTTLYLSANSWVEFVHVLCRPDFRDGLPQDLQDRFQIAAWDDWPVREA
jgi:predicted nucleic acid-binding protein